MKARRELRKSHYSENAGLLPLNTQKYLCFNENRPISSVRAHQTQAWRRITTGANWQYKKYFRRAYYAYEIAAKENIKDLSTRIKNGLYEPGSVTRIYVPKSSGLQRPITLLGIEDQIVLQAVANYFASMLSEKRETYEFESVFSNVLSRSSNPDGIFFFMDWHKTHRSFLDCGTRHFKSGKKWVVTFDLAAFYDTVSHELLLRSFFKAPGQTESSAAILKWLKIWSSEKRSGVMGHGLPQGPIAADWLAECFLFPVDVALRKAGFAYARYVDDIRIFSRTEREARLAALRLERS